MTKSSDADSAASHIFVQYLTGHLDPDQTVISHEIMH